MKLNNLKIYCQTEEDQTGVVEFISSQPDDVKISTWEPDGDDENPGSWGIFIDNFHAQLMVKLEDYLLDLLGEEGWEVDMSSIEEVK